MAFKPGYVVHETLTNVRRNVTLTIAAIVTIGVSLSLFGSAMLIRSGVDSLSARWQDDVRIALFLDREIGNEQREALEAVLEDHPEVAQYAYYDEEESRQEFERLFATNEAMIQRVEENPDLVPTSYRVVPQTIERDSVTLLVDQLAAEPGVRDTASPLDAVENVEQLSGSAQTAIFVSAVGLLGAAVMLILNAIRTAIFARRREIEVMKLVGATNWFIRVPFMLEGVVQGIAGSLIAVGAIVALNRFVLSDVPGLGQENSLLNSFVVSDGAVNFVIALVIALGTTVGALGSGWAVSRFLRA
jgi:cell division transport system permease protein